MPALVLLLSQISVFIHYVIYSLSLSLFLSLTPSLSHSLSSRPTHTIQF